MRNPIRCQVGEETILLDVDSQTQEGSQRNHELWRAETYTTKEPDTLKWIDAFFHPGDVIYDIGANIGQYSLYAAKRLKGQCQILAFEPEALNYAKLNRNIVLNGLTDSITAYCLAIAGQLELGAFYVQHFAPGAALHAWDKPETQGEKLFVPEHKQGMMAVSVDELTHRFSLPFPNHLKIDVDGIEQLIIDGAQQTLSDLRLRSALVEVFMHGDTASHIQAVFARNGFTLHNADTVVYQPGTVHNLIFTRECARNG